MLSGGCVSILLFVDAVLALVFLLDVTRFRSAGLSLRPPFHRALTGLTALPDFAELRIVAVLGFLVPSVIALARVAGVGRYSGSRWLRIQGRWVAAAHALFVIGALVALRMSTLMRDMAGPLLSSTRAERAFQPFYLNVLESAGGWPLALLALLASSLLGRVWWESYREGGKVADIFVRRMRSRVALLNLGSALYPVRGRHEMDFLSLAFGTNIRFVVARARTYGREYGRFVTGSAAAADCLRRHFHMCREWIQSEVLGSSGQRADVEVFSGTSRALDVALTQAHCEHLLLSTYEHPSEIAVARGIPGCTVHEVPFSPEQLSRAAEGNLEAWRQHASALCIPPGARVALLVSHVCYATGEVLPVDDIIKALKAVLGDRVVSVVDGSHFVGNVDYRVDLKSWDFYVFSAHKWLLSPEPCGILLRRLEPLTTVRAYDSWTGTLPTSTANARMIFALHAALDFTNIVSREDVRERTGELKRLLLATIRGTLEATRQTAAKDASALFSLRPVSSLRWEGNGEGVEMALAEAGVFATVLKMSPEETWVRVAMPYFHDGSTIYRASTRLRGLVVVR